MKDIFWLASCSRRDGSISAKASESSCSPPLKLVPLSQMSSKGFPLLAMKRASEG